MAWNYRIMRHVERIPGADNDEHFYAIHEVYYREDGGIEWWTEDPCGSPCGATLEEMIRDLAWIMAGLTKPVLAYDDGSEVGPAAMLADDIMAFLASPDALSPTDRGERG